MSDCPIVFPTDCPIADQATERGPSGDPLRDRSLAAEVKTTLGRPLPEAWPSLSLPCGTIVRALPPATQGEWAAAEAVDAACWRPSNGQAISSPKASPKKRKGKGKAAAVPSADKLCTCGKVDTEQFMLCCDECDRWFHGSCVRVTPNQASKLGAWRCRRATCARRSSQPCMHASACGSPPALPPCGVSPSATLWCARRPCERKFHATRARTERYCACRGPWDGASFMIMCDGCQV